MRLGAFLHASFALLAAAPYSAALNSSCAAHLSRRDLTLEVVCDGRVARAWPVGVGGFNFQRRCLTPKMSGLLSSKSILRRRSKPPYYKGLPFVRILDKAGGFTQWGFHIFQYDRFYRGYLSHGCVQMREADLADLVTVIDAVGTMPLRMDDAPSRSSLDVPYSPFFTRYKNFGTTERPTSKLDENGLEMMEQVWRGVDKGR